MKTSDPAHEAGIEGFREHMVSGLTHGVINFRHQPGTFKKHRVYEADGKHYHLSEKVFIKNEHFPDGIYYSFPAWFLLLIGLPALSKLLGGFDLSWLPGFGEGGWYPGKRILDALGVDYDPETGQIIEKRIAPIKAAPGFTHDETLGYLQLWSEGVVPYEDPRLDEKHWKRYIKFANQMYDAGWEYVPPEERV